MIFQKVKKYKINKFDKNLKKVLKIITNKDEIFNLKCQRCKKIKKFDLHQSIFVYNNTQKICDECHFNF